MIVQLLALGVALGPLRVARRGPPPTALAIGGDALLRQSEVLEVLSEVEDATLADMAADAQADADLVSLGLVRSVDVEPSLVDVRVAFEVPIEAASAGAADRLRARCEELLRARLDWLAEGSLSFDVTTQAAAEPAPSDLSALQALADNSGLGEASRAQSAAVAGVGEVGHIVAVASCKGGVGKSTTAVNLAYALAAAGERVGIVDLDIHGPSLPTMARPDGGLQLDGEVLLPLEAHGVKLMSMGFINPGAMPLRGAKVTPVVQQLVGRTAWGALDFLIVDMPPGTGDVQLTLAQDFRVSAAVLVTTPQRLSFVDVVKGVEMFHELDVPTLAVVENMSFFECDRGVRYRPFGDGHARELREQFHLDESQLFELPLSAATADANERALPLTLPAPVPDDEVDAATAAPAGTERAVYDALARRVIEDVYRRQHRVDRPGELPRATRVEHKHGRGIVMRVFEDDVAREYAISPVELRLRDPRTGRRLGDDAEAHARVPQDVKPKKITPKGSYGHAIEWSDGHKGVIYRNEALLWAARDAAGDV